MSDPDHVRFHARSVVLEHPDGFCHLLGFADGEVDAAALSEGLRRIFQGCDARLSLIDPA
ncbi:MAG: hypothetical protein CL543_02105 [Alcanivorax sp.]|nr:hypothetical protein [Alcanivorax sp.]